MRTLTAILQLAGFGSLGYGLYLYEKWAAFAVCGAILLIVGLIADTRIPK